MLIAKQHVRIWEIRKYSDLSTEYESKELKESFNPTTATMSN